MTRHYVISDLHLGMGRMKDQTWHPLEDFKSDALFRGFLDHLADNQADELIINGDWVDFLQLEPDAYDRDRGYYSEDGHILGWTEQQSKDKFDSCKGERAHKGLFEDLKHFLETTGKKLTVIQGNHDPDLFWPLVQDDLCQLLGKQPGDQLEFSQTFVRRGTAHIEHGNQYCSPENKFANPTNVFHDCVGEKNKRLEMVWGTIFVMEFFNDLERDFPFADNIKTQSRALWLGIKNRWVNGKMAAKFVKFMWSAGIPWSSVTANVLSPPKRQPYQLLQNLSDPRISAELLKVYATDPEFKREFDDEITSTSTREWQSLAKQAQLQLRAGDGLPQAVTMDQLTPDIDGGSPTLGIFRDEPEFRGARELLAHENVEWVVFGHTHAEIDGADKEATVPKYFNTGTWVNSIDLSKRENRKRLNSLTKEDLSDDTLFDLRLRTAVIEIDADNRTTVRLEEIPT